MQDYRKLKVWEESHALALSIYKLIKTFPDSEKFGIISQMTRAASSIPANIVEGAGRNSQKEFKKFLFIARASSKELEYYLILARDLGYLSSLDYEPINMRINLLSKMLTNLIKEVNRKLNPEPQTTNSEL